MLFFFNLGVGSQDESCTPHALHLESRIFGLWHNHLFLVSDSLLLTDSENYMERWKRCN